MELNADAGSTSFVTASSNGLTPFQGLGGGSVSVPGAALCSAPGCSFDALRANRDGTWNRRLRRADCRLGIGRGGSAGAGETVIFRSMLSEEMPEIPRLCFGLRLLKAA